jgi:hypothetical protein
MTQTKTAIAHAARALLRSASVCGVRLASRECGVASRGSRDVSGVQYALGPERI